MSYAVRKVGKGWRVVASESDCNQDEVWQDNEPPMVVGEIESIDPLQKLKDFLAKNPDVVEIL